MGARMEQTVKKYYNQERPGEASRLQRCGLQPWLFKECRSVFGYTEIETLKIIGLMNLLSLYNPRLCQQFFFHSNGLHTHIYIRTCIQCYFLKWLWYQVFIIKQITAKISVFKRHSFLYLFSHLKDHTACLACFSLFIINCLYLTQPAVDCCCIQGCSDIRSLSVSCFRATFKETSKFTLSSS